MSKPLYVQTLTCHFPILNLLLGNLIKTFTRPVHNNTLFMYTYVLWVHIVTGKTRLFSDHSPVFPIGHVAVCVPKKFRQSGSSRNLNNWFGCGCACFGSQIFAFPSTTFQFWVQFECVYKLWIFNFLFKLQQVDSWPTSRRWEVAATLVKWCGQTREQIQLILDFSDVALCSRHTHWIGLALANWASKSDCTNTTSLWSTQNNMTT